MSFAARVRRGLRWGTAVVLSAGLLQCAAHPPSPRGTRCRQARDCPAPPDACSQPRCADGVCSQLPVERQLPDPAPGDCVRPVCALGRLQWQPDPTDVPAAAPEPCVDTLCTAAGPSRAFAAAGKPCGEQRVCDGRGGCAACVPGEGRCAGKLRELCDAAGAWQKAEACAAGAPVCSAGRCVRVTQIAAGLEHTCALLSDQTVRCWGDNQHAAVGSASPSAVLAPQQLQLPPVEQLATGAGMHSCARLQSGQLACWGLNDRGQTGLASSTQPQRSPLLVAGVSSAVDVAVGAAHSCALQSDGAVLCWGSGERGQLGDGTRSDRNSPARVAQLPHALRIALGDKHGCALLRDNTVQCWGGNSFGEAGLPTHQSHAAAGLTLQVGTEALVPQAVAELPTATGISAGTSRSCALLEHGAVRCWGGERFEARAVPVKGVEHATALGVAGRHACALRADAKVVCWGNNEWGQLGDGTRRDRASAGLVDGLSEVESLGVGKEHTCAVLRDGSASCWGSNTGGKLGDGTRADRLRATPVAW